MILAKPSRQTIIAMLQEYCDEQVSRIRMCFSESGRAMTAHHAVLVARNRCGTFARRSAATAQPLGCCLPRKIDYLAGKGLDSEMVTEPIIGLGIIWQR